jgi:dTDP-4-amino-4,6-dideoxygalactose transaminase
MHVPFIDLQAQNRSLRRDLDAAIAGVIDEARFILGPAVERFEADFAAYVGVPHCVGTNNGTTALHMALLACGVGPGDEVITTPATWISTSWAISYVGAKPVYVDIDPVTFTLDPEKAARAITPQTKAILPVHLYGQTADLSPLRELAEQYGLALIEDAAQAHGARYGARRVGGFGKVGCFSFYPGKNLGALGESGCVVTHDAAVAERLRVLRDHAQQGRHHHVAIGYNTRMEGLQGAVLSVKLRKLDEWNAARRRHAALYTELLAGVPGLVLPEALRPEGHVWHLYVVRLPRHDREAMRQRLAARGVTAMVHYPTLVPFQPAYAHLGHKPGDFPVAEELFRTCLSLPLAPELSGEQVRYAARMLIEVLQADSMTTHADQPAA